jgi:hypothetical protein
MLDRIIQRAGVRINAEDAAATDRLERLERQVERFGEKLEDVCEYLGLGFDAQDRIRRPPALYNDEFALVNWPSSRITTRNRTASPEHLPGGVDGTMPQDAAGTALRQDAAGTELQQDAVPPSLPTTGPQPTFPASAGDISTTPLADDTAAPTTTAGTSIAAANAGRSHAAPTTGATSSTLGANETVPQDPVDVPEDDSSAERAALAAPSAEIGHQSPPTAARHIATNQSPGPLSVPTADVVDAPTAIVHPGITVVHPTPDNSQDTAATHTTLVPPGPIKAAGMQTRSKSRSLTPVPQLPTSLPVPDPNPESSSSKPRSTGSSRVGSKSPRVGKRKMDAEGGRGKRSRQG